MSGYYPPGVTGLEPEIAGYPERDSTETVVCDECDEESTVELGLLLAGGEWTAEWTCSCGHENTYRENEQTEPDPDDLRDRMLDD